MEPVYDPRGKPVGWFRNGVVFDADAQPVAFIRQNAVFTYERRYCGRLDRCFFRDQDGHAVAFMRGATGSPRPPIPQVPLPPKAPGIPRVPAVAPVAPAAPMASLSWSPLTWQQFLGVSDRDKLTAQQPPAAQKSDTVTEVRGRRSSSPAHSEMGAHAESRVAVSTGESL